jgi:hypothetical protein
VANLRKGGRECIRCGTEDGTIVLCHYTGVRRGEFGGGMGIKVHDAAAAEMCHQCHSWLDTISRSKGQKWEHSEQFLAMIVKTWIRRMDDGLVTVKRTAL